MLFWCPLQAPSYACCHYDIGTYLAGCGKNRVLLILAALASLALGACEAVGGNALTDAFGLVAFVAMTPLVTIQLLGLVTKIKGARVTKTVVTPIVLSDEIVEFDIYEGSGVNE